MRCATHSGAAAAAVTFHSASIVPSYSNNTNNNNTSLLRALNNNNNGNSSIINNFNNNNNSAIQNSRRFFRKDLFEGPLDTKPGHNSSNNANNRKGPPVAHSLPVYKTTHKLNHSVRWKKANLVTNVAGGQDYRLRETQGEGHFDETGMYRDWLYGDERRYANYVGAALAALALALFLYTMRVMSAETWDLPAPVLAAQRKRAAAATGNNNNNNNNEIDNNNNNNSAGPSDTTAAPPDALAALKRPQTVTRAATA